MKKGHWFVAIAGILSGTIIFGGAVFAKMGLSMLEITIFRGMFALLLLPYIIYKKDYLLSKKMLKIFITFGLIVSLANLFEFAPVILGVPVAISVLLLYTAPLWTVIFSKMFFKEEITKYKWFAIVLVLAGIIFLVNPFTIDKGVSVIGLFSALIGGIFLSLWGVYGKVCGNEESQPIKTQFYETVFALTFTLLFYPVLSYFIKDSSLVALSFSHPLNIFFYMFIFYLVSYIIPHFFYFTGVKEIPASTAGVILLLEPLAGAILAALFLAQAITMNVFVGGIFILAANYLVIKTESNNKLVQAEGTA